MQETAWLFSASMGDFLRSAEEASVKRLLKMGSGSRPEGTNVNI